jgi:hypothetical protein
VNIRLTIDGNGLVALGKRLSRRGTGAHAENRGSCARRQRDHPRAGYTHGTYRRDGTVMHVSPGLGTTFLPFRFFARPEATELRLQTGP